ncbi:MAG: outer envelope protein [Herbaspirillum sp.]|jgi:nucleoside-specific outer membrane channel protein Tsx|nr:outer envelope protein [Herbaspirillum sp.]
MQRSIIATWILTLGAATAVMQQANALEWSDTSVGYRYGNKFEEPFNGQDISKHIVNLTHADGYAWGTNYLNLDILKSDKTDNNSTEAYLVYRNTLDIGKISGKDLSFGPVSGAGLTLGFDWNTKNDPGYSSHKRMLVAGPTLMMKVPGFLNISLLALQESNYPVGINSRYTYKTHAMLDINWGIPIANSGWAFEGYMNYIGAKGKDEFGGDTSPETDIDAMLMYDLGTKMGWGKNKVRVGVEYQYWRNKFGNQPQVAGSLAKTPMVRAEYHF